MSVWGSKHTTQSQSGRFRSQGLDLAFETAGEGPAVVLVHGFASSSNTNWKTTGWFEALVKAGYRAVALDNRGHGQSDKPRTPGAYAVETMARDVGALIAHLGLRRPHLFGYSMGSRIVLSLLMQHPSIAASAIVGGVGMGILRPLNPDGVTRMVDAFEAEDIAAITDRFARRFRLFAERQKGDLKALGQCYREVLTPLPEAGLAKLKLPVLVAYGTDDDHLTDPRNLARQLPDGRYVEIPGKDHMTVIADPRYKAAILEFLASVK